MSDERMEALRQVAGEVARHLAWLRDAGVREVPQPVPVLLAPPGPTVPAAPARPRRLHHRPCAAPAAPPTTTRPAPTPGQAAAAVERGCGSPGLLAIRADLGDCRRCKLAEGRTHLVFGVGDPRAELMFVGEGPGADEDQQGEPFVGKAGQLLTRMIEAMGYRREQVYIANVVKCRPPGNRNPEPDEIEACEPFLRRQIEAVGPRVIVALGKFAAHTLAPLHRPHHPAARPVGGVRRGPAHADLPPRLPAPEPAGEGEGLGGPEAGDGGAGAPASAEIGPPRPRRAGGPSGERDRGGAGPGWSRPGVARLPVRSPSMRRLALAALAALALLPAVAQAWSLFGGTRGDGQKVTQPRQVAAFTSIRVEGSIDAAVKVGGAPSVSVTIDQNLQPLVTTEVSGYTLVIRTRDISWDGKGIVEITVPALRAFTIEGSGDVAIDGGQGDLALEIEGSGDLRWSGSADKLEASISGSGDMKLSGTADAAPASRWPARATSRRAP